jgi:glycerol uptake facilitator-like aquaporin
VPLGGFSGSPVFSNHGTIRTVGGAVQTADQPIIRLIGMLHGHFTISQSTVLIVILGTTHQRAPVGFAGLAIGLALTLIHLISIPVTNTSVNPARSTGPAIFVGGWALQQLWLFWLAPAIGAAIAGFTYKVLFEVEREPPVTRRVPT